MCNSLRPHGLQPTRLLHPRNFPGKKYWNGLPFPFPGDLPDPGIEPGSPALQADALLSEPPGTSHWVQFNSDLVNCKNRNLSDQSRDKGRLLKDCKELYGRHPRIRGEVLPGHSGAVRVRNRATPLQSFSFLSTALVGHLVYSSAFCYRQVSFFQLILNLQLPYNSELSWHSADAD